MGCRGLILTGTDTDVGKTHVGCLIAEHLVRSGWRVGAYKPVASGFPSWAGSDGQRLWDATGRTASPDLVSPQRFDAPFAPSVAATMEGKAVDEQQIFDGARRIADTCDLLLIEGAGGLLSPISPVLTNADLAVAWHTPIVIVANWRLGVVHQILATMLAAEWFNLPVAAIVLSAAVDENPHPTHRSLLVDFLQNRCESTNRSEFALQPPGQCDTRKLSSAWRQIPIVGLGHNQTQFDCEIDWASLFLPIIYP